MQEDSAFTSLSDVLSLPQFRNKVVYVDVWGTTCTPCMEELKNFTPKLTARYRNSKDMAFLYLCLDRHPIPELRWKEKLRLLQPEGYHVLIRGGAGERKLALEITGEASEGKFFPYLPYYFIVNREGRIVGRQSADPENSELRPSDGALLYQRLDSVLASH